MNQALVSTAINHLANWLASKVARTLVAAAVKLVALHSIGECDLIGIVCKEQVNVVLIIDWNESNDCIDSFIPLLNE